MKYLNYKFAHHHVHSEYSPLDAPVSLKKLVNYSKDLGYKTVTITDHGTVSAWVKLATYCKEKGLKPIFGIEGYFTPNRNIKVTRATNYHCVLLAKNDNGVKNIMRLSELAYTEGFFYDPRFDWELLEKYHDGVICTSACVSGLVPDTLRLPENDPFLAFNADGSAFDPKSGKEPVKIYKPYDLALEYAKRFKSIFGQDFYCEVQYHGIDVEKTPYAGVARIAKELNLKLVGTNDVHYLKKEDANTQEMMMAINMQKCIKDPTRMRHDTNQFYLKSPEEMVEILGGKNAAAVQGALEIADVCTAELNKKTQLPSIEIPKEYNNEFEYLSILAKAGLVRLGKANDPIYVARLEEELDVIRRLREKGLQFDKYFLLVHDYVNWAWNNNVRVGVARGSGAGSLILYSLRVTGIDPIKYDLLFERFLAEDRNEMPDIDIDFDHKGRERVWQYICGKYGINHCARIGTFSEFHAASAIKSAFRVFDPGNTYEKELLEKKESDQSKKIAGKKGIQLGEKKSSSRDESAAMANEITKLLPKDPNSGRPSSKCTLLKERAEENDELIYVYDEVPEFINYKKKYPEIFSLAEKIEGLRSSRSVHAAGVLVTKDDLVNICPQQFSGKDKKLATAFDMGDVEKVGGVKFDLLSTKALSAISHTLVQVENRYGKKIDIDNLLPDDPEALNVFKNGDTTGIFQFESYGMREMLKGMGTVNFEDVIAANALYRPGPMKNIPLYLKRKRGEKVTYQAPALEPILKPTLGIIIYQEQVMKTVRALAGFTASEADKVRKAMGKKKQDLLDKMKDKFVDGCSKLNTCSPEIAKSLWGQMETFGAYAFNRSHSAGYSYTAYQCAYLKAHYPHEFMAAQISIEGDDAKYEVVLDYERALKQMKIQLLAIDINLSKEDYVVIDLKDKKTIRRGFCGISGIGSAGNDIVKSQPYKDMFDYCMRSGSGCNSGVSTALMDVGAFDSFLPKLKAKLGREVTRIDLMAEYNDKSNRAKTTKKEAQKNKGIATAFAVEEDENKELELTL